MVNNEVFGWFAEELMERCSLDVELVDEIQKAIAFNGVSLDKLFEKKPDTALRLRNSLKSAANEASQGFLQSPPDMRISEQHERMRRRKFAELIDILDRWNPIGD